MRCIALCRYSSEQKAPTGSRRRSLPCKVNVWWNAWMDDCVTCGKALKVVSIGKKVVLWFLLLFSDLTPASGIAWLLNWGYELIAIVSRGSGAYIYIYIYTPLVVYTLLRDGVDAFVSRWFKVVFTTRDERSLRHLVMVWQSKHTKHQQDGGTLKTCECYMTPKSRNRIYTLLSTLLLLLSNKREKQSRKWELKDKDMEPNLWFKNYNHKIKGLY